MCLRLEARHSSLDQATVTAWCNITQKAPDLVQGKSQAGHPAPGIFGWDGGAGRLGQGGQRGSRRELRSLVLQSAVRCTKACSVSEMETRRATATSETDPDTSFLMQRCWAIALTIAAKSNVANSPAAAKLGEEKTPRGSFEVATRLQRSRENLGALDALFPLIACQAVALQQTLSFQTRNTDDCCEILWWEEELR